MPQPSAKRLPVALAFAAAASIAQAQTPAAAPATPEHTLTANVGIFSEYIFRGISQTAKEPALQGGFDYAHSSGFYLGTWGSNVSWLQDFGAYNRSSLEWDFYGGYKAPIGSDGWFFDVGGIYYYYPGKRNPGVINADTFEVYGAIGWNWVNLKISYSLDDYFGARPTGVKTDGTIYYDLSAAYPIADTGFTLIGHVGHLDVDNDGSDGDLSTGGKVGYTDWKIGLSYVIPEGVAKGLELGIYYTDSDAKKRFYTDLTGYDTSKGRGVVYVKKTF
jgi:uncharacterized protein (TIGR02001 family)